MLREYLESLRASNTSEATISWYKHKWNQFIDYFQAQGTETITPEVVRRYLIHRKLKVTPHTVQGDFSALHAGFTWGIEHGLIERSPMERLHKPKAPIKQIIIFTADEFRAMLMFFYDTGLRESELIYTTTTDMDIKEQRVKVTGKGSRERVVPFGQRTRQAYESFALTRNGSLYAFPNETGGQLSDKRIWDIVQDACIGAKIPRRKPHALRHTFACNYLDAGGNEIDLMYLLGHSSLTMVNHYAQWTRAQRAIRNHSNYSPGDRL